MPRQRRWCSSLRLRYALVATGLAGVAFVAGGAVALTLYRDNLYSSVTQAVSTAAQQVAIAAHAAKLPKPIPMPVAAGVPRIQILDSTGRIVTGDPASVSGPPLTYLARQHPGRIYTLSHPADLPDKRAATITIHVTGPTGPLAVIAAASLDHADNKVGHALVLSGILAAISLVVTAAAAWLSAGRTLRRVDKLRTQVEAVTSSGDVTRQLPDPRADELGRLADTLNHMLAAIATSSARQRRFVADAAHELRTPIAGVTTTLEIAARHPHTIDQAWIDELLRVQRRLAELVNNLLELAALDEGRVRPTAPVDLAGVVTDVTRRIPRTAVQIVADDIERVQVDASETHLDRIVTNLLDNARRYAATTVKITLHQHDGHALLTVDDDGPGIPPEQRQPIWERFARIDHHRSADTGGTGLGLALVKELTQAHHGTATVTQAPQLGGARFEIRIPTQRASQPPSEQPGACLPAGATVRAAPPIERTNTGAAPSRHDSQ